MFYRDCSSENVGNGKFKILIVVLLPVLGYN